MIFFPKKFQEVRERHGMTLKEVADKIGVAESSVHNWERGIYSPRPARVHKIAELFKCSVEEFADFEPGEYVPRRLTGKDLASMGVIVPGIQLSPGEHLESFRRALLNEIMMSKELDAAAKEIAYKIVMTYQLPPITISAEPQK